MGTAKHVHIVRHCGQTLEGKKMPNKCAISALTNVTSCVITLLDHISTSYVVGEQWSGMHDTYL